MSHELRKTLGKGRLRPLEDRMSTVKQQKRQVKIEARKTVAQVLGNMAAQAMGRANLALSVIQRGFFGRLKWLLFGR